MKTSNHLRIAVVALALLVAGPGGLWAESTARIPGATGGSSGAGENIIEGSFDKYDSTLNKLTIKLTLDGVDADKETLDAVPSLKAKDGTKRLPMALVKPGQKIRVTYVEKGKKKLAKDVEIVHLEELDEAPPKKEKDDRGEPRIPGAP